MPLTEIIIFAIVMIMYCIFAISTLFKADSIFVKFRRSFGYISSFIFAYSSIVTVCAIALFVFLLTQSKISQGVLALFYTLIFLVISVVLYKKAQKKCDGCSGVGLFWGMFRIGISAQMYLGFILISLIGGLFIDSFKSTGSEDEEEVVVTTTYSETFQGGIEAHTTIKKR